MDFRILGLSALLLRLEAGRVVSSERPDVPGGGR
jgi:hypothetical protein